MSPLHRLAEAAGLQIEWESADGKPQRVSDESLRRVLAALGFPAESDSDTAESLARCETQRRECPFVSADLDRPTLLPGGCPSTGEVLFEDGDRRPVELEPAAGGLVLPPLDRVGYHRLVLGGREIQLALAPPRCFGVDDAAPGRCLWGPAVQIPALRDAHPRAFGDFGSLADAARRFAGAGGDAVAISPVHALFPADPGRFSPYAPSSRLFLNILLADPGLIGYPLPPAAEPELIDWEHAIPARLAALREAFRGRGDGIKQQVAGYAEKMGGELRRHAVFDALHAHFFPDGARGWQDWPAEFHDPGGEAVVRFADRHADEVEFFVFAQWLAHASLTAAHNSARDAGMAIGLIADLAVGMDGGGSHAWSRPDDLLDGLSIGAPPDPLGPEGQDWGITGFAPHALKRTGFAPFIATLRAALDHAGGIRIDHALGLNRLWVVPHGASSAEGAYLTYPLQDMLRVLAIESHKARTIVIGEDLGTVPDGLRPQLEQRGVMGMRVLWFEREADGAYILPERWHRHAVAMSSTHDVPTVAGWWRGRDLDWASRLGRLPNASETNERAQRAEERERLWHAFEASGAATGPPPSPEQTAPVVDAAVAHVGSTPCELALFPLEDIAGLVEQPNLPGTTDEHPNWRRRMPETTEELLGRTEVGRRVAKLEARRR